MREDVKKQLYVVKSVAVVNWGLGFRGSKVGDPRIVMMMMIGGETLSNSKTTHHCLLYGSLTLALGKAVKFKMKEAGIICVEIIKKMG